MGRPRQSRPSILHQSNRAHAGGIAAKCPALADRSGLRQAVTYRPRLRMRPAGDGHFPIDLVTIAYDVPLRAADMPRHQQTVVPTVKWPATRYDVALAPVRKVRRAHSTASGQRKRKKEYESRDECFHCYVTPRRTTLLQVHQIATGFCAHASRSRGAGVFSCESSDAPPRIPQSNPPLAELQGGRWCEAARP